MIKKTISYIDYNGNERTEDHYFNLSEAELAEMELSTTGGLTQMLRGLISAQDMPAIVKFVKNIILKSYGKKAPDGRQFLKGDEISREFVQTEAYSKLFMELCTSADAASEFVNGLIPENVRKRVEEEAAKQNNEHASGNTPQLAN